MRKTVAFTVLLALLFVASCSAPGDAPATKFVAFLDKHKAAINEGKFDVKAFEDEGKPLVAELRTHRDPKDQKILMTEKVLAEWQRANKEFAAAADKMTTEKADPSAAMAYTALVEDLTK